MRLEFVKTFIDSTTHLFREVVCSDAEIASIRMRPSPVAGGDVMAIIGLMGKLELPPFDAPEAETEIVSGALTEYSGRGLALFRLGKGVEMVVGLTLVAAFYMGGVGDPLSFFGKTLVVLLVLVGVQALLTRLRIDQTVGLWWRFGSLLALAQLLLVIVLKGVTL